MRQPVKQTISIVVPCYCEAGNIERFYTTLSETIDNEAGYYWKILFIDDGSHDETVAVIRGIVDLDARVSAIVLARNFGKEAALMAGIQEAFNCDAAICLDADLQHPPKLIPQLLKSGMKAGLWLRLFGRVSKAIPSLGRWGRVSITGLWRA